MVRAIVGDLACQSLNRKWKCWSCPLIIEMARMVYIVAIVLLPISCHSFLSGNFISKDGRRRLTEFSKPGRMGQDMKSCETYCPDSSLPRAQSLNDPVPPIDYPPLIHHIQSERNFSSLKAFIVHETNLPEAYVVELISFGAVYLSVPKGKLNKGEDDSKIVSTMSISTAQKFAVSSRNADADGLDDDIAQTMTRVSRVLKVDTPIPKGSYGRVHVNPRRCRDAAQGIDWRRR